VPCENFKFQIGKKIRQKILLGLVRKAAAHGEVSFGKPSVTGRVMKKLPIGGGGSGSSLASYREETRKRDEVGKKTPCLRK